MVSIGTGFHAEKIAILDRLTILLFLTNVLRLPKNWMINRFLQINLASSSLIRHGHLHGTLDLIAKKDCDARVLRGP